MNPATIHRHTSLCGIENTNNSCFLNACIQILNSTTEVATILRENADLLNARCGGGRGSGVDKDEKSEFAMEWVKLNEMMMSSYDPATGTINVVSPNRFLTVFRAVSRHSGFEMFDATRQHDMVECLCFFFQTLHDAIKVRKRLDDDSQPQPPSIAAICRNMRNRRYASGDFSEITERFYGIFVTEIVSMDGQDTVHSARPEDFFVLSLPILPFDDKTNCPERTVPLFECLDLFLRPEIMQNENAWFNERTQQKEPVMKRTRIWRFPEILIISFQRFFELRTVQESSENRDSGTSRSRRIHAPNRRR